MPARALHAAAPRRSTTDAIGQAMARLLLAASAGVLIGAFYWGTADAGVDRPAEAVGAR